MSRLSRRNWLGLGAGLLGVAAGRGLRASGPLPERVVIVGGGFAGATVARYLGRLAPWLRLTLVEATPHYTACPMSNAVIGGIRDAASLRSDYTGLGRAAGLRRIRARASRIDHERARLHLADGSELPFDRLVIAPGVRMLENSPTGYDAAAMRALPHGWEAGPQTLALRASLASLADGAVVGISVPPRPFRCPPGPYERASLMAAWLHRHRRRCKLIILDSNPDFSKQALFMQAWQRLYPGLIEWRPIDQDGAVRRVDAATQTAWTELDAHRFDLLNVIPGQKAAALAADNDLTDATGWCPVAGGDFRSTRHARVHVLGDASLAGAMPKSASAANSQAKNCALAIAAETAGMPPPDFSLHNTCYSLADRDYAISVNMIYRIDAQGQASPVAGAGGVSGIDWSADRRRREADYASAWFASIMADSFG